MLRIDVRVGESIQIGNDVIIHIERKNGQFSRIAIDAPRNVPIKRVANDNKSAASDKYREATTTSD